MLQIFWKFPKILQNSENCCIKIAKILQICLREDDIREDLEKCCKMRILTRKSAVIQPRMSLGKSDFVVAAHRSEGLLLGLAALRLVEEVANEDAGEGPLWMEIL